MKNPNRNRALALLAAAMSFSGCHATPAVAPNVNEVAPVALRSFPASRVELNRNTFFLWREDTTHEDVKTVLQMARKIERLKAETEQLNGEVLRLTQQVAGLMDRKRAVMSKINETKPKLEAAKKEKAAEESKAPGERDLEKIAALAAAIAQHESEIKANTEEKGRIDETLKETNKQSKSAKERLAQHTPKSDEALKKIWSLVDWYVNPPELVVFDQAADGSLTAQINGWDLNDGAGVRSFSTDEVKSPQGSIEDLEYAERGGVYTFKLKAFADPSRSAVQWTFCFRLTRARYGLTDKDGSVFFAGDFIRQEGDASCESISKTARRGTAKLLGVK